MSAHWSYQTVALGLTAALMVASGTLALTGEWLAVLGFGVAAILAALLFVSIGATRRWITLATGRDA